MSTIFNTIQALFISLNLLVFAYLSYIFLKTKKPTYKLYGFAMALLSAVQVCILGVTMLWTIPVLDFKSLEYLLYLYAILVLFAVSASVLKQKTKYFINIFLAFFALIVTGYFFINPSLNNATAYTVNFYLSFDNPATVNIFSLTLALSFGMAALVIGQSIKDKMLKSVTEAGFLVVIACLVINLISVNDTLRLITNIIQLLSLLLICFVYRAKKLPETKK